MAAIGIPMLGGAPPHAALPRMMNFSPVISVLGRILSNGDLARPFKMAFDCIDSSALVNVSLVSLKSLPYVMLGDHQLIQSFDNGISCRLRYLEAALTSTASFVYNFVFGIFFSAVSLVTLGQVKMLVDQMRKHWIHTGLALGAIGISLIGTCSPELGAQANGAGMFAVGFIVFQWAQADLVTKLSSIYQTHRQELRNAALEGVQGDRAFFDRQINPLFNYLDTHLNARIRTFSDLMNVLQGASVHLPNILPENIIQSLQRWILNEEVASGITARD